MLNSTNKLVKDSYVSFVNLDHRVDRLERMKQSLDRIGLEATRTPGIIPTQEHAKEYPMMWNRTRGAIGCYLSQLQVMKEAQRQGKHAFVMEDDLVFCEDFGKRMDYINDWSMGITKHENWHIHNNYRLIENRFCAQYWDIIWLGATFHVGGKGPYWHTKTLGRDAELTSNPRMIRTYGSFCTYAYIVHKNSLEKVIDLHEQWIKKSIGIDWTMIQISPNLHTFAFVPGCTKQYDNISDQVPERQEITRFSKFEKLNGTIENSRYWYQERMEDFDPTTFNWAEAKYDYKGLK